MKKVLFIICLLLVGFTCGFLARFVEPPLDMVFSLGAAILPLGIWINFRHKFGFEDKDKT